MEFVNPQSRFVKKPFRVAPFEEYVKRRISDMTQPLSAPPYAMEGEQARMDALTEYVQKDPYGYYESINNFADNFIETHRSTPVTRLSDPVFYDCMKDCCDALGFRNTVGYVYEPTTFEAKYNAIATGYLEMTWVMVSTSFREKNLIDDLELAFLIGHELGHTAARHGSLVMQSDEIDGAENRRQEHTADRAGLLAVLWRVARLNPGLSAKEMTDKALAASNSLQRKLELLNLPHPRGGYTAETLAKACEEMDLKEKRARKNDSHPTCWERVTEMTTFVDRITFLECIRTMWGEDHPAARRL